MTRFMFITIKDREIRAYAKYLRKRIPQVLDKTGKTLAIGMKNEAKNIINQEIPSNRRTGTLENGFIIKESQTAGRNKRYEVVNVTPYANFIDANDITATTHKRRKITIQQIRYDSNLKRLFEQSSDFYKQHKRLPMGANIGMPGGKFFSYSIFARHPNGIQFMSRSFNKVLLKADTILSKNFKQRIK